MNKTVFEHCYGQLEEMLSQNRRSEMAWSIPRWLLELISERDGEIPVMLFGIPVECDNTAEIPIVLSEKGRGDE